jgi:Domain of unknown function (DUF3291)
LITNRFNSTLPLFYYAAIGQTRAAYPGRPPRLAWDMAPLTARTAQCAPRSVVAARRGGWHHCGVEYLLAQVNIARLREPLDSPLLADFVAALDPVNAAADEASGFVWRLQTEEGNATAVQAFEWDQAGSAGVLVNMSVWESVEALAAYVYSHAHRQVLGRRRQWFERMATASVALWWIPRGHTPTTGEAEERVLHLRVFGPTPYAFTLKEHFPPPDAARHGPIRSPEEWTCPA